MAPQGLASASFGLKGKLEKSVGTESLRGESDFFFFFKILDGVQWLSQRLSPAFRAKPL